MSGTPVECIPGITHEQVRRLRWAKYECVAHVIQASATELMCKTNLILPVVHQIQCAASRTLLPTARTALHLDSNECHLRTGFEPLDECLNGGIPSACITELVGPAGVGKTQWCHTLATMAAMGCSRGGLGTTVAWIDTENTFCPQRLWEVATNRLPHMFSGSRATQARATLMERVRVYAIDDCESMESTLFDLQYGVIHFGIGLILVDSIASVARREYGYDDIAERQLWLASQARWLKTLAQECNLCVVLVNQVTTSFHKGASAPRVAPHVRSPVMPLLTRADAATHGSDDGDAVDSDGEQRHVSIGGQHTQDEGDSHENSACDALTHLVEFTLDSMLRDHTGDAQRNAVAPSLGTMWSHCVNVRIVMEFDVMHQHHRLLTVAKSPQCQVVRMGYIITRGGIDVISDVTDVGDVLDVNGDVTSVSNVEGNWWRPAFSTRAATDVSGATRSSEQHTAVRRGQ